MPSNSNVYTVIVTDENQCTNIDSVYVEVDTDFCPPCVNYSVPNAFTPNGDQVNDYFNVLADGAIKIIDFRVYDRFGNLIHHSPEPWGGTFKGELLPSDVYFYTIRLETNCGTKKLQGDMTLIR